MKAAEQILKQYKIAVTGQRLAILDLFLNSKEPLNHGLLEKKTGRTISRYTVYRTLKLFLKRALLQALPSQDGIIWYIMPFDSGTGESHTYIHFMCRKCGIVYPVTPASLPLIIMPENITVETTEIIMKGYCINCK